MAKHNHIHTRFNAHSKGTLSPIHKGHNYHMRIGVCNLRGQMTIPSRNPVAPIFASRSISAWYTKMWFCIIKPNPTAAVLHQHVRHVPASTKQRTPASTKRRKGAVLCNPTGLLHSAWHTL